jgi:hypothetical protein
MGDPGPKGDPGAPGMPGMNAMVNFYSAQETKTGVGPSSMETPIDVDASCDAGDVATSGDCKATTDGQDGLVKLTSHPIVTAPNAATGWSCHTDNGYDQVIMTATVLCVSKD